VSEVRGKCGAFRRGVVDLLCSEKRGHDQAEDGKPGTWHKAVYATRQEITYPGAYHVAEHRETVTWEPVDHVEESMRHMHAAVEAKRGDAR
jgi:hypothetical protein